MASTKIVGKAGSVEVPGQTEITGIKSWTLDITADVVETTSFDDAGVRAYLGTVTGWSGSFEGYKTGVPIVIGGAVQSTRLFEDTVTQPFWTGNLIVTGLTANSSHDGLVTYAYTFQGTGVLTEPGT